MRRSGELAIAYQVHGAGDHDLLMNGGTARISRRSGASPRLLDCLSGWAGSRG